MRSTAASVLAALILLNAPAVAAQSGDELGTLRREVEALKAGQESLRKELQEIRSLLRQPSPAQAPAQAPEPRDIALSIDGAPVKGDKQARLVLVDFSDYQ